MPLKRRTRGRPPKAKVIVKKERTEEASISGNKKLSEKDYEYPSNVLNVTKAKYTCCECNRKFRFRSSFKRHLKNDHATGPGSVPCKLCIFRCPDKKTLEAHINKVHERAIFECEHCKKTFVRRSHVLRHISQMGCDGKEQKKFPCEICDATFARKDNLMVHLRTQHIMKNAFVCKFCPYHTQSFSRYVIHFQRTHSDTPDQYICDHCGQITKSRTAMAKHLEIHGDKKFECTVCGYSTYTVEVMRRHILTHVANKPHKCKLCDSSYIQRVQLQRHMQRHHENTCATCGVSFVSKGKLLMHIKEHFGVNKLECTVEDCQLSGKIFSSKKALQKHIEQIHEENKDYKCEVCTKRYSNEMNMRRHMLTHTLERPRRCMYCVAARAYVRGEQLVKHVRKAHPDIFRHHLNHVRRVLVTIQS